MRRALAVAVVALTVAAAAAACSDDDDGGDDPGPGPLPDLSGDTVPLPPRVLGEEALAALEPSAQGVGRLFPDQRVVVTEVEGLVVVVGRERLPSAAHGPGFEAMGEPGPSLPDGRPTRVGEGGQFHMEQRVAVEAEPGLVITASARGTRPSLIDELVDVLTEVELPITEPGNVPGRRVGVLGGPTESWRATYDPRGRSFLVQELTPEEQAAYRALAFEDPERSLDPMTHASCCTDRVMQPLRELSGDRRGWIGTVTPYERVMVLEGDPGVLVFGRGSDRAFERFAAGIGAGSPVERERLQEELRSARRERSARAITRQEESIGWRVVARADIDDVAVVVSAGSKPRPEMPDAPVRLCASIVLGSTQACLDDQELEPGGVAGEPRYGLLAVPPDGAASAAFVAPGGELPLERVELAGGDGLPEAVFVGYTAWDGFPELVGETSVWETDVVYRADDGTELGRFQLHP